MNVPALILEVYEWVLRILRRFGLPVTLVLCYLTAIGLRYLGLLTPFGRVEIELAHRSFGLLLCVLLVVLLYDRVQRAASEKKRSLSEQKLSPKFFSASPKVWVDRVFFGFLGLIVVLGLLLHFQTRLKLSSGFSYEWLYGLHSTLVWFFLSVILVRYYLTLTKWLASFWAYLKEY